MVALFFSYPILFQLDQSNGMNEMNAPQKNNPLHGKTLESILLFLVDKFGWEQLGAIIRINCFTDNPSIQSSLKFLRKTEWARKKVEDLYIEVQTNNYH